MVLGRGGGRACCCVQQLLYKNDNGYETGYQLIEGDLLSLAKRWKMSNRDVTLADLYNREQVAHVFCLTLVWYFYTLTST